MNEPQSDWAGGDYVSGREPHLRLESSTMLAEDKHSDQLANKSPAYKFRSGWIIQQGCSPHCQGKQVQSQTRQADRLQEYIADFANHTR